MRIARTKAGELLERRVEVHARRACGQERGGEHKQCRYECVFVVCRPLWARVLILGVRRPRTRERVPKLLAQDQNSHREQEQVSGHVMAPAQPRHLCPLALSWEQQRGIEQGWMRVWR